MSEKEKILDDYVFHHLREYHNVVISNKVLIRHGEAKIIEYCFLNGFRVRIHEYDHVETDPRKK